MMYKIGDGIISPLGSTTEENFQAVKAGYSGIRQFPAGFRGLSHPILAALISPRELENLAAPYAGARTHMMSRYRQAMSAVFESTVSNTLPEIYRNEILQSPRIAFIFCTTKGDVDSFHELSDHTINPRLYPWHVSQQMMNELNLPGKPYVVMNSTLAGMQAQMVADRLLCKGSPYDFAVIIGVELISMFTVFLLSQAGLVSDKLVRPFDKEREGTNPGESASCAIYVSEERFEKDKKRLNMPYIIKYKGGALMTDLCKRGDIDPNRNAMLRAIQKVMTRENARNLSFINAQVVGLANFYNMTSIAIEEAGLHRVPVNCFEGYFGHSSGSTSLISSILGARSLEEGIILPTLGFRTPGIDGRIQIVTSVKPSNKNSFLNVSAGFGGVNAVTLYTKEKNHHAH